MFRREKDRFECEGTEVLTSEAINDYEVFTTILNSLKIRGATRTLERCVLRMSQIGNANTRKRRIEIRVKIKAAIQGNEDICSQFLTLGKYFYLTTKILIFA